MLHSQILFTCIMQLLLGEGMHHCRGWRGEGSTTENEDAGEHRYSKEGQKAPPSQRRRGRPHPREGEESSTTPKKDVRARPSKQHNPQMEMNEESNTTKKVEGGTTALPFLKQEKSNLEIAHFWLLLHLENVFSFCCILKLLISHFWCTLKLPCDDKVKYECNCNYFHDFHCLFFFLPILVNGAEGRRGPRLGGA